MTNLKRSFFWAAFYLAVIFILGQVVLEFVLLEAGVWLAYQLALQISHAESVMDALALVRDLITREFPFVYNLSTPSTEYPVLLASRRPMPQSVPAKLIS